MASVDMCEHGWPGSGCRECFPQPETQARLMYEKEAKNWPNPMKWDDLPYGTQMLWVQRAERKLKHDEGD